MSESVAMPLLAGKTVLETYAHCQEVLTKPKTFEVGAFEPYSEPVWGGVMAISNDGTHLPRRRLLASLLSRSAMERYDGEFLSRAIEELIAAARASEDPVVDLIQLVRLMLVRVIATIVGIDGVREDRARALKLMACIDGFISGTQVRYSTRQPEEVIAEAVAAVEVYREELYEPSRRRRQELAQQVAAGQIREDEVPDDVIMRQQGPRAPEIWNEKTALRDSLTVFAGGLQTSAVAVVQSIDDYYAWAGAGPEAVADPDMVRGVVNESLRLRPPVPYILRRASEDVTLRDGHEITAGEELALDITAANRDVDVFGADANEYRPERFRELPPKYPQYGLAFGAGSHVCYGKPLATVGGTDPRETHVPRVVTKLVGALLAAGVRPAREQEPTLEPSYRNIFRTFPVEFPAAEEER